VKILAIDTGAECLDLLMRCQDFGHEVLWFTMKNDHDHDEKAGTNIVPKLVDYDRLRSRYLGWADLIYLADNTHYMTMLEPLRKIGYPIFGMGTPEATALELDREAGQKAMKDAGLNTIPGVTFHDYDAAARYVEKHPNHLVSKPSGEADRAMSYVAHDAASLQYMMLDRWAKNPKYVKDARKFGFILQEKKKGCEFAVGGWFGPHGWSRYWYENFEYKKLMANDLGPNTGEMGTLSMYVKHSKLADIALKPMTKLLKKLEYVGFVDINGMIDEDGEFWPFEFTMRDGWPTHHNQNATHEGDPAKWRLDLTEGRDTLEVKEDVCCISVVLAIPDFPYSKYTEKLTCGIPIFGAEDRENVHLKEVMRDNAVRTQIGDEILTLPGYVSTGDEICIVTGIGQTITGARRSAYSTVKKIRMPADPFYRPDIGAGRLAKDLEMIQAHGFATGFKIL
jgi:phosphoribosylamine---glycine ligase